MASTSDPRARADDDSSDSSDSDSDSSVVIVAGRRRDRDDDGEDEEEEAPSRKRARDDVPAPQTGMQQLYLQAQSLGDVPPQTLEWAVQKGWHKVVLHLLRLGAKLCPKSLLSITETALYYPPRVWRAVLAGIREGDMEGPIPCRTALAALEVLLGGIEDRQTADSDAARFLDALAEAGTEGQLVRCQETLASVRKMLPSAPRTVRTLVKYKDDLLTQQLLRSSKLLSGKAVTAGGRALAMAMGLLDLHGLVGATNISSAYMDVIREPSTDDARQVLLRCARKNKAASLGRLLRVLARRLPSVFADGDFVYHLLRDMFYNETYRSDARARSWRLADDALVELAAVCSVPPAPGRANQVYELITKLPPMCFTAQGVRAVLDCLGVRNMTPVIIGHAIWAIVARSLHADTITPSNHLAHLCATVMAPDVAPDLSPPPVRHREMERLWDAIIQGVKWGDVGAWGLAHATGIDWITDLLPRLQPRVRSKRATIPPLLRFRLAMMEAERGEVCDDRDAETCPAIQLALVTGEHRAAVRAANALVAPAADGDSLAVLMMRGVVIQDTALRRRIQHSHVLATAAADPEAWYAPLCANDGAAFNDFDATLL